MTDPVDRALDQLRDDHWSGSTRHPRIEAAIADAAGAPGRSHRGLVLAVIGVLVGTAIVSASMSGTVSRLLGLHASGTEPRSHVQPPNEFDAGVETADN